MDEVKELLKEENNKEQENKELKERLARLEQELAELKEKDRIYGGLDKAIEAKKQEIYEARETLRELTNKNESLFEKLKKENTEVALDEFAEKYNITEEDKKIIIQTIEENPPDAISKEKILRQIKSIYFALHPEIVEKLEQEKKAYEAKIKKSEVESTKTLEEQIKTTSSYEPSGTVEEDVELTSEELEFCRQRGIDPKYYKKVKKEGRIVLR